MRSSKDIVNIEFQKSVNGYKPSDVKSYLTEVAEDYAALQRRIAELESERAKLAKDIETLKADQYSVQNLLVKAQRLADETVADARAESERIVADAHSSVEKITAEAEAYVTELKRRADETKKNSEAESRLRISKAETQSENMLTGAHDSVARQQLLFDKLRSEVAAFKNEIVSFYKKQLEAIEAMPVEVPFDAEHAAEAMAFNETQVPDWQRMAAESGAEQNIQ